MNIILVHWTTTTHNVIIDGRMPMFTNPYQAGYWVPECTTDRFIESINDSSVSQVTIYRYDKTYKM